MKQSKPRRGTEMARDITISSRELSPFEKLVLELVCEGKSNGAIAKETAHTEKVIENNTIIPLKLSQGLYFIQGRNKDQVFKATIQIQ
jgi:hypothetical protein